MAGKFPDTITRALQLSALLDVDPFCLLVPKRGTVQTALNAVFQSLKEQDSSSGLLDYLKTMYGWKTEWPPPYWVNDEKHHAYAWHVQEFSHDPTTRRNFYKQVGLVADGALVQVRPQTFHFAYSGAGLLSTATWLNYGFVVRHRQHVRLIHMHGFTDQHDTSALTDPTWVETYFGPGAANFRVASLHPFELLREDPEHLPERCVRFPG